MKHCRPTIVRIRDQGSVTIIVAALLTALFAMAALAVDAGHMYLINRNLQEAADAAVMAGLPALGTSTATAQTNARNMAIQCGYPGGNISTSTGAAGGLTTLTVTITDTEPFFFAKALRFTPKTMRATATGQTARPVPAVFAGRNVCTGSPNPTGAQFNGGANSINITGNVESNGNANAWGGAAALAAGNTVTYGSGAGCGANGFAPASTSSSGGSLTSPFSYTAASFTCTYTAASWSFGGPGFWWQTGGPGGTGTLTPGVYCATAGNINVSGNVILSSRVTLVATGQITISATSVDLQAFDTTTNILAYTPMASSDCGVPAITAGSGTVTLNGYFYAPNGCVNMSGNTVDVTGALVGDQVSFGVGSGGSITSSGGGGGGYWMYK